MKRTELLSLISAESMLAARGVLSSPVAAAGEPSSMLTMCIVKFGRRSSRPMPVGPKWLIL
jgi:hypothetical protein